MKLTEEVGELSRAIRKNIKAEDSKQLQGTIDEELWDIIYYAIAIANIYDIDLENVIKTKSKISENKYQSFVAFEEGR